MADELDNPVDPAPVVDADATPAPATEPKDTPKDTPKDGPKTVLDTDTAEPEPKAGDWPDDWREKMAAGDEKLLGRLKRFQSPLNVLKSWRNLEQKLSSGELRAKKPEDMSGEEHAKWRSENGIPEKPEGYLEKLSLPDGLQVGDEDKPILESVFAAAHESDLPPEAVNKVVAAYYKAQDDFLAQRAEKDRADSENAVEDLRAEWGREYKANINSLMGFLDTGPEGAKDLLAHARLGDGTALMNNPGIVKWLVGLAREQNPMPTIAAQGGDVLKSINDEISDIESKMGTAAYTKDPKMRARYRELVDAREKMAAKGRAA